MAPNWPAIRAGIFAGESGGDYNALFGFSNREGKQFGGTKLTDMTVDQALAFANPSGPYAQWVKGQVGRVATPMGAYQVVGTTLKAAKDGLGLTGNERMTEDTQDRVGQWILAKQGTGAWEGYRGPREPESPYAGLPDGPKGQEAYAQPGLAPATDTTQTAGILGGVFGGIPQGIAEYASAPEPKSFGERLQGAFKKLADYPDAPPVRFSQMGDARQSGSDLLKQLQKLRQG